MKNPFYRFILLARSIDRTVVMVTVLLLSFEQMAAQNITVSGALVGNGSYPTLNSAFAAINAGAQTGANIVVQVVGNTNEGTASSVLQQGDWNSLTISPSGGAFTISGNPTNSLPLIRLNGADRVTIDGLNTSGNALTLTTPVTTYPGNRVIEFVAAARNNVIRNCSVLSGGLEGIFFEYSNSNGGSNDNTVAYNTIGPSPGAFLKYGLICYSLNTNGQNSNCSVIGNKFFNCIGQFASGAIYLQEGYSGWTISDNRIYMASPYSINYMQHACIYLGATNASQTTLVSGNVIGFSNPNGTGRYEVQMTVGGYMAGIYVNQSSSFPNTVIRDNKIDGIQISGTLGNATNSPGTFAGVACQGGSVSLLRNRVGSWTNPAGIEINATGNSFITVNGISAKSSFPFTVESDTVAGIIVNAPQPWHISFRGIVASGGGARTIRHNRVGTLNAPIDLSAVGESISSAYGIASYGGRPTVESNEVAFIHLGDGQTAGRYNSAVMGYRIGFMAGGASSISHNLAHNLACYSTSSATDVVGIGLADSSADYIYTIAASNQVHSLVCSSPTGEITGFGSYGDGNSRLVNNMVRVGYDSAGMPIQIGCTVYGIHQTTGILFLSHNSIYVGGSGVSGSANTYAAYLEKASPKNNIFFNARSNGTGTGKHYVVRHAGGAPNQLQVSADYNNLYASGNGAMLGRFGVVDCQSIYKWRTVFGHDSHSISTDPRFINPSGSSVTGDLHLQSINPMEGAGTSDTAVTVDIDGQSRMSFSPTDIGADAGNFTTITSQSPAITYTAPSRYCGSGDLTFTAVISSPLGIPTSGPFQPKVYYRKNTDPIQSVQGTLLSGNGTNGVWSFSILAATVGGFVNGDVMSYYVAAQDVAGTYLTAQPGNGWIASDVNTVSRHPFEWNTYGSLQGTYCVGGAGTFTNLTGAAQAYENSCLTGPVTFLLVDSAYHYETYPISFKSNPDASSVNQLTIKPYPGVNIKLCGNSNTYLWEFAGADHVTLDGSYGNITNEICPRVQAQRNLSIHNTEGYATVSFRNTATGDSTTHCGIKNCRVIGNGPTPGGQNFFTGKPALAIGGALPDSNGAGNNHNLIENNEFRSAWIAIKSAGGAIKNYHNIYRLNSSELSGNMDGFGFIILNEDAPVIHANRINGGRVTGISLGYDTPVNINLTTGKEVTNADLRYNLVASIQGMSLWSSACGIAIAATSTGTTTLINNMVVNPVTQVYMPDLAAGIYIGGGAGHYRLWHNTVRLTGHSGNNISSGYDPETAIAINGNLPSLDMKNNIFHENGFPSCMVNHVIGLAYSSPVSPYPNMSSNYNNIWGFPANPIARINGISANGTPVGNLASWMNLTGNDQNSTGVEPIYASYFPESRLLPANNPGLIDRGTALPQVLYDFDCDPRNPLTPDMGADEMPNCPPPVAGTISSSDTICTPTSITLLGTGYSPGSQYLWQSSPAGQNNWSNTTSINPASFSTGSITASRDYRLRVGCTNGTLVYSNVVTITMAAPVTPSVSIIASPGNTACPGTPITFTANTTNVGSMPLFHWYLNGLPAGNNSTSLTLSSPSDGDEVYCTVQRCDPDPCVAPGPVVSNLVTLSVTDTLFPVWTNCPTAQTLNPQGINCSAVANWSPPVATDNCSLASTVSSHNPGDSFGIGSSTVSYTTTDVAGNSATCTFIITVTDTQAPQWTNCPSPITIGTSTNSCTAVASWIAPTATDNCPLASSTSTHAPGVVLGPGVTTVTYTATDQSGQVVNCSFTITVVDQTPPTAICQNISLNLTGANGSILPPDIDAGSQDACTSVTMTVAPSTFTCANAGSNPVVLTVSDANGNSATCAANVQVIPMPLQATLSAPAPYCGYNINCNGASNGQCSVQTTSGCPSFSFLWSNGATTSSISNLGAGTYQVTVTDGSGTSQVHSTTLTSPPMLTIQTNAVQGSCQGSSTGSIDINVSGGNSCQPYLFQWSNNALTEDISNLAPGSYSVTVTDVAGCATAMSFNVPTISPPLPTIQQNGNVLSSVQTWTSYQWYFNGSPIPGATSSTYPMTNSGVYALQVTDANGCIGASGPFVATSTAAYQSISIELVPNPANTGFRLIPTSAISEPLVLEVRDVVGRLIHEQKLLELTEPIELNVRDWPAATYYVSLQGQSNFSAVLRVVVQH